MRTNDLTIANHDYARLIQLAPDGRLAEELSRATVLPEERMPRTVVRMNSRVTYVDEQSGQRREVVLVYPEDADPSNGKISILAPVGTALLGLEEGQTIDWPFPNGTTRRLRVERTVPPEPVLD